MKHLGYAAAILSIAASGLAFIAASGLAFVVFGPFSDQQLVYETDQGAVIWLSEKR